MVDVWTEVEAHQYNPAISPIVYECLVNPAMKGLPTNQKVVDESLDKLKKVLEVYEARLSKTKYLAGDFVSFADLNHFPYTYYFMATPHASVVGEPHVQAVRQEAQRQHAHFLAVIIAYARSHSAVWE
ncbi:hypothetical protein PR202_gb20330 [Eleusine coracana subsp. coracana]|uniref:glutathione transferase n=1 Tax=Eleusine coracana subsp. coracana TaxID=191504 RepID=A0AAV5FC46_ELECO|nr:hypothetical protein QOZ80_1BG0066020 [Eleusine coracana subsp. coracana]GJN31875.1 hypothetical protein PR202_gb20330 [Eleusine coracana subsp. coracana]